MNKKKPNTPIFPREGLVRLRQIIGDPNADPPIPAFFPVSHSQWYAGMKDGIYPKPVKLSRRTVAWRVEDIRPLGENGINLDAFDGGTCHSTPAEDAPESCNCVEGCDTVTLKATPN